MTSCFVFNLFEYNPSGTGANSAEKESAESSTFIKRIPCESGLHADFLHISCIPLLIDFEKGIEKLCELRKYSKVLISLPFVSRGNAILKFREKFVKLCECADGFTVQNFGDYDILLDLFSKHDIPRENYFIAGDYSLNITNSVSAAFWSEKLDSVAILPELSGDEQLSVARAFPKKLLPETVSEVPYIVMRSEHCFAVRSENFHCGACGKYGLSAKNIIDENQKSFRLICNPLDCNCILVND